MSVVKELIRNEADGTVSFGDYTLTEKTKLDDFAHGSDTLKVKTFNEITRLEKNGLVVYESVPGTAVSNFNSTESGLSFVVEGPADAQITVGLEADAEYDVAINGATIGKMKTNLGGKLNFSVELEGAGDVKVEVSK